MKLIAAVFTALVGLAAVQGQSLPSFGEGQLHDDMQYFLDMIPMDEVLAITLEYAADDAEFQQAIQYAQTEDFKQLLVEIQGIPEFRNFLDYMQKNGVYIYDVLNMLNDILGIERMQPSQFLLQPRSGITGGLAGYFNDVKALISYDKFIHGYVYKMKSSDAFRNYVSELKSQNFQTFIDKLYANQRFKNLHSELTRAGVNLAIVEDVMFVVLGISFPTQGKKPEFTYATSEGQLSKDLAEFVELAFTEDVIHVMVKYISEDEQVQNALEYAYNEEFHEMVRAVEALKEYQNLVIYLHNAGLNVFEMIQKVHEFIEMEDYVPPIVPMQAINAKYRSIVYEGTGGIKGLVDEIMALLPVKELRALYEKKMETSKAFADFIEVTRSDEFQKIVDSFYSHEIFLEMRRKATEAGLDLQALADLLHAIFGLKFPKPSTF